MAVNKKNQFGYLNSAYLKILRCYNVVSKGVIMGNLLYIKGIVMQII